MALLTLQVITHQTNLAIVYDFLETTQYDSSMGFKFIFHRNQYPKKNLRRNVWRTNYDM